MILGGPRGDTFACDVARGVRGDVETFLGEEAGLGGEGEGLAVSEGRFLGVDKRWESGRLLRASNDDVAFLSLKLLGGADCDPEKIYKKLVTKFPDHVG